MWNHRVCKRTVGKETAFEIHEVYYDDDGSVEGWTENAVAPCGENLAELRRELMWMLESLEKPIIDLNDPDNSR